MVQTMFWIQILLSGLVGIFVIAAAFRLFQRAPGWPGRTLALCLSLATQWICAPLLCRLVIYLTGQLPYFFLFLLCAVWFLRPLRRH